MKAPEVVRLEADLRRYLQNKSTLFSPEIAKVVVDINKFTSAILQGGFQTALAQLGINVSQDCPFIEVCDAMVENHIGVLKQTERDLVAKSLFEAYVYAAGSEHAFEPACKTRIVPSLRRRGTKGFATLFLSLHLFNVVSMEIQDDVRGRMPDLKSFEIHMLWIETICRDIVTEAMKIPDGNLDERWAAAICKNIEARLLHQA